MPPNSTVVLSENRIKLVIGQWYI